MLQQFFIRSFLTLALLSVSPIIAATPPETAQRDTAAIAPQKTEREILEDKIAQHKAFQKAIIRYTGHQLSAERIGLGICKVLAIGLLVFGVSSINPTLDLLTLVKKNLSTLKTPNQTSNNALAAVNNLNPAVGTMLAVFLSATVGGIVTGYNLLWPSELYFRQALKTAQQTAPDEYKKPLSKDKNLGRGLIMSQNKIIELLNAMYKKSIQETQVLTEELNKIIASKEKTRGF